MKISINSLHDVLGCQLQRMYFSNEIILDGFKHFIEQTTSSRLKALLKDYSANAEDKILKLERIFNYLMHEPVRTPGEVILQFFSETNHLLAHTSEGYLKDILILSCFQNIVAYKISSLKSVYSFVMELDLDVATELVQQLLELEIETGKELSRLAVEEFNKVPFTS